MSITAVVWLCRSRRRVYHTQQRTAMDARVPGLQISSRPTHRFFVERKNRRFARTNPKHSHIEKARCASRGRIIANPSSYLQSFTKIHGHDAEIGPTPHTAFIYVAKGTCTSILIMFLLSLVCQLRRLEPLQHAHTTCHTFQIGRDTIVVNTASTVVAISPTCTSHDHGIALFAQLPCCALACCVPVT